MTYEAIQWTRRNYPEVLDLIGSERKSHPAADQLITVMTPDGVARAQESEWIYRHPADPTGTFRVSRANPDANLDS